MTSNETQTKDGAIVVQDRDCLRYVTIAREARANALSISMLRSLADAVTSAGQTAGVEAVVLAAAGTGNFCAGADMSELKTHRREQYDALRRTIDALARRPVPVISILHGKTLGAGCLLPALSDVVIAPDDAVLGFPEMRFGMYPALLHAVLVERLPATLVSALCVGARFLSAHDALVLGLVTEVLPAVDFALSSRERLAFYAARVPAIRLGREMLTGTAACDLGERVDRAEQIIERNLALPDVDAMLGRYRK
ncbi:MULTISPECIES: enoyl-CoA hydratase/isomerase family protein [Burkholderia]|uniref:enoyl-CoA hydratase/isomerase family protein n=1 Tax=Burkholderia TaxID=32008 RepID=UPI000398CBC9|nr:MULTISPECIES: enoyl-CoA hydratase/isomerase family protein [Burkholderia]ERJ37735.1 Enoyl-CoA hydratase [Burkholderia sp. AU4i]